MIRSEQAIRYFDDPGFNEKISNYAEEKNKPNKRFDKIAPDLAINIIFREIRSNVNKKNF